MLYRAHLAAGAGLGVALAAGARAAGAANTTEDLAAIAGLTAVFALLPDLDTASVIQRWTYRFLFGVLVWLMGTGRADHAAFLGAVSLLPLVHRHRGWMHAWWAVLAVPLGVLLMWDGYWIALGPGGVDLRSPGFWAADLADTLAGLSREVMTRLAGTLPENAAYLAAMIAGYALHLTLDFYGPAWLKG